MSISKSALAGYRARIESALEREFAAEGFSVKGGSIRYDSSKFSVKLDISSLSSGDTEKLDFARVAPLFRLSGNDFERTFTSSGRTFKLVKLAPNRPKFPVIGKEVYTGKLYKFTDSVLNQLR